MTLGLPRRRIIHHMENRPKGIVHTLKFTAIVLRFTNNTLVVLSGLRRVQFEEGRNYLYAEARAKTPTPALPREQGGRLLVNKAEISRL